MAEFFLIHQIVESNGRTIKENNLDRRHNIPLGTLVEVKFDEWFGNGGSWKVHARLWVVAHCRDCDGTPLYSVGRWPGLSREGYYGFTEDRLRIVPITPELLDGEGALEWKDEG